MLDPTQGTSYFVLLQRIFGPARDQGQKVETCCAKEIILGKGSNNQNGNLRWFLPLGVRPIYT